MWGSDCEGVQSGRHWSHAEKNFHINYLRIKAAFFALKCLLSKLQKKHVRLMLDNVTAVSCLNHMGTNHSVSCNAITQAVRTWWLSHNIWISAAHIPDKDNIVADQESRQSQHGCGMDDRQECFAVCFGRAGIFC